MPTEELNSDRQGPLWSRGSSCAETVDRHVAEAPIHFRSPGGSATRPREVVSKANYRTPHRFCRQQTISGSFARSEEPS